jgi:CRP-like cAMP-binding protein
MMTDIFEKYIHEKVNVTDEEYKIIRDAFVTKKLKRKQYLLQEGDVAKYIAFVTKGILRSYKIDVKGNENILQFAPEEWWITDRESILTGKPSEYNIDAIENSELLLTTWKDFKEVGEKVPAFRQLDERLHQNNIIAAQKRIHAAISYTAEENYNEFINTYPQIVQRVPQHMIASYLGLSPETLSRIRSK